MTSKNVNGVDPSTDQRVVNGSVDANNGNGLSAPSSSPSASRSSAQNQGAAVGGARPKIRKNPLNQVPDVLNHSGPSSGANAGLPPDDDDGEIEDEDEELTADLPKSFYNLDYNSDGDNNLGVSGAGQSNLSLEVAAALRQNETRPPQLQLRRRINSDRENEPNAANVDGGEQRRPESPEFLEMDFDPDSASDSGDSGRGADETTDGGPDDNDQPVEAAEQERSSSSSSNGAARAIDADHTVPHEPEVVDEPSSPLKPLNLPYSAVSGAGASCVHQVHGDCGVTSAPLQSPAGPSDDQVNMVRSKSLNSPFKDQQSSDERLLILGSAMMERRLNRRHHSGSGIEASAPSTSASEDVFGSDPSVNREACGVRLSNRETLVFGLPSPDKTFQKALKVLEEMSKVDDQTDQGSEIEKTMVWTELEACKRQVNQVGVSACGATAVINVLRGLDFEFEIEDVIDCVNTKLRANDAPVATYLFSRSIAGTDHNDLIEAVEKVSEGQVFGRFFHMYPKRKCNVLSWVGKWIKKGVVPLATLNRQRGEVLPGQTIPDAWHHQMVFGVGPSGMYMTNPLESLSSRSLQDMLASPSELLIRRHDVVMRWGELNDLHLFQEHEDERWDNYNVLGQVVNVLREEAGSRRKQNKERKQHITIPALYKSGITLFCLKSNEEAYNELKSCPELPLAPLASSSTMHQLKLVVQARSLS